MPPSNTAAAKLINISLVHSGTDSEADTHLGVVIVPRNLTAEFTLPLLRQVMKQQLCQVLPERFVFCSKTKHDIQFAQEKDIYACQIWDCNETIFIRSNSHDTPHLLIKSNNNILLGHLFTNYNSSLTDLRAVISSELPDFDEQGKEFRFLCSDGSPVPTKAEERTPVHEVMRGHEVHIDVKEQLPNEADCHNLPLKGESQVAVRHTRASALGLSFSSSKDLDHQHTNNSMSSSQLGSHSKQLLISYVSAEAAEHAVNLKRKLTDLGYSVYLDVHEIKSGVDWQDALNYAVSNCEVFIPLVTPRYGETQWTNREVKLADVLGKPILPVSFLEEWPPKCLAIQFATTQFVCWKSSENMSSDMTAEKEEARDIRLWEERDIEIVAGEIMKRLKKLMSGTVSKPALKRMKTLMKTFAGRLPASVTPELSRQDSEEIPGPQIVLCVHSQEASFGLQLKSWLEVAGYSVWTSARPHSSVIGEINVKTGKEVHLLDNAAGMGKLKADTSSESSSKITVEEVKEFQEAVDKAMVVIIVLSKAFIQSWICRQQVFYCEHRKQILPVAYEELWIPSWLKMLIRTKKLLNVNKPCFYHILLMQVKRALDPTAKTCLETDSQEANITLAVDYLKHALDVRRCLYVAGASQISGARCEEVCRSIGTHLAQLSNIDIVTGGCYGTSELVGRTFYEESQKQFMKSTVWHILPEQDSQDMSKQYNQSSDGTFALKDFGQTLFCGNSVWEREAIVGRCFQICLLTEGGPNAAHEVEEFVWNDHIIIPVYCAFETGAILEEYRAAGKMFQLPPGVSELDWKCLHDRTAPAEDIGKAVANILSDLLKHLDQPLENPSKGQTEWLYLPDPRDI